jgi:hypothetical protein
MRTKGILVGTSRNDRSPLNPPWRAALAVLGTPETSADRQCLEIWRAVAADRGERMFQDFASRPIQEACRLASTKLSPQDAVARFDATTRYDSDAGLVIDMSRRALARCAAENGGATQFVSELFAEAVSYYASRDLPSYVAAKGRIANSSDSIALKNSFRRITKEQVESVGPARLGPKQWRQYIAKVLNVLVAGGGRK